MSSRVVVLAAFSAFALVGCSNNWPIENIVSVQPRTGGGVTVIGEHDEYDGLAEREESYFVSVELDDNGQVLSRKDVSSHTSAPLGTPVFADGTTLDVIPATVANPGDAPGPLVVRGLDGQGTELWRTTLTISTLTAFCADAHGGLILAGLPAQPSDHAASPGGVVVLELTADGQIIWQRTLH